MGTGGLFPQSQELATIRKSLSNRTQCRRQQLFQSRYVLLGLDSLLLAYLGLTVLLEYSVHVSFITTQQTCAGLPRLLRTPKVYWPFYLRKSPQSIHSERVNTAHTLFPQVPVNIFVLSASRFSKSSQIIIISN